ncbi:hypothetical protein PPYR_05686 [Photinus pyralis]|uniref:Mid1-interacting protein 1 n=1 Tax=Photinus pyralis TaxID=7054 RepID=A0A1Y1L3Y2_PHOPY|nr:uncharacterized protein LOC116166035 [Photinus pyralis]KAB0801332.1 hypothetical protein PPYR_05686 [Photinus pyralis]
MNNYSDNISNNVEESRCYFRRLGLHDNSEFSNQSIITAISELVKSITTMDETILVPCRLMDLKVGDEQDRIAPKKHNLKNKNDVQEILSSTDLFDVYNMLNSIKADLLWGQNMEHDTSSKTETPNTQLTVCKGHIRRPSTVSVTSTNSSASIISDSESETGNENDSGIEEPPQVQNQTALLAQNFRRHLKGLTRCIRQMSDATQYLTLRYQHDIGNPL